MTRPSTPGDEPAADATRVDETQALAAARRMASHPYFLGLPLAELAALIGAGSRVDAAPGDLLIRRGDHSDFALLLVDGSADVTIDTPYEHVHLATFAGPAVIGEIGAFTGVERTAHVRASTPVFAIRLSSQALEAAGEAHPVLLSAVMHQFGQRFETFNRAFGFYANALNALERRDFDLRLLDELRNPLPELVNFAQSFRRLAEEIMVRQAERRERANAAAIQRAMLPGPLAPEALAGRAEVHAEMRPAQDVGGDFYDCFFLDANRLVVSVGDVAGKGIPAALFMSATQTVLRTVLRSEADLSQAMRTANDLLCANNSEHLFVTAFCGVLDLEAGTLDFCNCGHPDSLVVRDAGAVERLPVTGMALAMMEQAKFRAERIRLSPGDRLFLFTDGLSDAANLDDERFGDARVEIACREAAPLPPAAFVARLLDTIAAFAGDAAQYDDMTALAVGFRGPAKRG